MEAEIQRVRGISIRRAATRLKHDHVKDKGEQLMVVAEGMPCTLFLLPLVVFFGAL